MSQIVARMTDDSMARSEFCTKAVDECGAPGGHQ
jgi:hypothetical protein